MANVSARIYEHHKKADGTYNVKICVYHKGKRRYIDTTHFVVKKQLTKDLKIKDPFVADLVEQQLRDFRKRISFLDSKLDFFTADSLRDYLIDANEEVDFVKFCDDHIARIKEEGRIKSAESFKVVKNSLIDFFRSRSFSINDIQYNMLLSYERYLKSERKLKRVNQFGTPVFTIEPPVSALTVHNYMRDLRTLFNAARNRYNDEDLGIVRIKHYPFKKYKVGTPPTRENERFNTLKQIFSIKYCYTTSGSRAELAKEMYLLSFYLCGINAVDLYNLTKKNYKGERLEYNRSKTAGRRKDKAFISIKIVNEANDLLHKYVGSLNKRYSSIQCLNKALSKGMEQLCKMAGLKDTTFYWARHSFANAARNDCRMSKDDVSLALNHVDMGNRTTDVYLARDWRIVDDVQSKVIAEFKKVEAEMLRAALRINMEQGD